MAEKKETSVEDELGDMLDCPRCMKKCKDPKLLPCHHWFCSPCFTSLTEEEDGSVQCPTCMEAESISIESIHRDLEIFSGLSISTSHNSDGEANDMQLPLCADHEKPLNLFCDTCQEMLCTVCVAEAGHESHTMMSMDKESEVILEKIKTKLRHAQDQLKKKADEHRYCIDEIDRHKKAIRDEAEAKKKALQEHSDRVIERVNQLVAEMVDEIDAESESTADQQKALEQRLMMEMSQLTNCANIFQESLVTGKPISDSQAEMAQQMLRDFTGDYPIPELAMNVRLADLNELTEEKLLGSMKCHYSTISIEPPAEDECENSSVTAVSSNSASNNGTDSHSEENAKTNDGVEGETTGRKSSARKKKKVPTATLR